MRDRWGYARVLTAGLSLALALFASGCLVAEGTADEAAKLTAETAPALAERAAPSTAKAAPVVELGSLAVKEQAETPALPPEDSELDYGDTDNAAHESIAKETPTAGVFFDPPPQPWTPRPH